MFIKINFSKTMEKDLKKLFDDCMGERRFISRLRSETIRGYNNVFDLFLKLMPEIKKTDDLSETVCKNFFKLIQERERIVGKSKIISGVKNSTIKTQMAKLNVFFKWLEMRGFIKENPLKNIKKPSVKYVDFKRVDDNDIHKLYSSVVLNPVNNLLSARDNMMISLLINCGLRKGEFISLRVDDVDLINKEITVRGETSKSNCTRKLPLNSTLITHIKEYFKERQKKRRILSQKYNFCKRRDQTNQGRRDN